MRVDEAGQQGATVEVDLAWGAAGEGAQLGDGAHAAHPEAVAVR